MLLRKLAPSWPFQVSFALAEVSTVGEIDFDSNINRVKKKQEQNENGKQTSLTDTISCIFRKLVGDVVLLSNFNDFLCCLSSLILSYFTFNHGILKD